jgi:hypothetical protein
MQHLSLRTFLLKITFMATLCALIMLSGCTSAPKQDPDQFRSQTEIFAPHRIPEKPDFAQEPVTASRAGAFLAARFAQQSYDIENAVVFYRTLTDNVSDITLTGSEASIEEPVSLSVTARSLSTLPNDVAEFRGLLANQTFLLSIGAGKWQDAERLAYLLLEQYPDHGLAQFYLGLVLLKELSVIEETSFDVAIHFFAEAAAHDKLAELVYPVIQSWLLHTKNKTDEAFDILSEFEKDEKFSLVGPLHMGWMAENSGRTIEAEQYFDILSDALLPERITNFAFDHWVRRNKAYKGESIYTSLLEISPRNRRAQLGLLFLFT